MYLFAKNGDRVGAGEGISCIARICRILNSHDSRSCPILASSRPVESAMKELLPDPVIPVAI